MPEQIQAGRHVAPARGRAPRRPAARTAGSRCHQECRHRPHRRLPTPEGDAWFLGSTYDRIHPHLGVTEEDHAFNLERLAELYPDTAEALAPVVSKNARGWVGVRCTLHDRLPFVGAVADAPTGLWINSAMGSRGLTLGLLCSEILVAQMTTHPFPVDARLVRAISSQRFAKKAKAKMQRI